MSLERRIVLVTVGVFLILGVSSFVAGNYAAHADTLSQDLQEQTDALIAGGVTDDLAPKIVCIVFNALTGMGEPMPPLGDGSCPNSPNPPPPPSPRPACSDEVDNDGDGLIDLADPGCSSSTDTDESNTTSGEAKLVVVKIVVNDNGGTSIVPDFSLHIATSSAGFAEAISVVSGATTTVQTGMWIVSEVQKSGYAATFGGDCNSNGQVTLAAGETKTCTIVNDDIPPPAAPACADGIDNDGDAKIDMQDPGCSSATDNDESDPVSESVPGSNPGPSSAPPQNTGGGSPASPLNNPGPSLGGGGGGGIVLGSATTTVVPPEAIQSCDKYLTAFIRTGQKNDIDQVKRLQRFLRDFEGAKLAETGLYESATLAAVHAFQSKYTADILNPWGARESTGYVYLTTRKKVNEIFCKFTKTFLLTPDELQKIVETRTLAERAAGAARSAPAASTPKAEEKAIDTPSVVPTPTKRTDRNPVQSALKFLRGIFDRSR